MRPARAQTGCAWRRDTRGTRAPAGGRSATVAPRACPPRPALRGRAGCYSRAGRERPRTGSTLGACVPDRGVYVVVELLEVLPEHLAEAGGLGVVRRRVHPRAAPERQ